MALGPILSSLTERTTPLRQDELIPLSRELAALPTEQIRDKWLGRLEKSGLVPNYASFRSSFDLFASDLDGYEGVGHIGVTHAGALLSPETDFTFTNVTNADGLTVFVIGPFIEMAKALVNSQKPHFKRYFAGAHSSLEMALALGSIAIDFEPDDLPNPDGTMESEDDRTLFAWEMLARVDSELAGRDPSRVLGSQILTDRYKALKAFIEMGGLHPMAERALAMRDGRERVFAFASGQGAKYLAEFRNLIETEPDARALFNEVKPLFAQYNIDLDHLLSLTNADQNEIENYFAIYGVTTAMPVGSLLQLMRLRVMESYGYDPSKFAGAAGQSGGQPFAYFIGHSFEKEGYTPPVVPHGIGGYHSLQAVRNFMKFMLIEGRLQQKGTEPTYAADVTRMEPLVKKGDTLPTAEQIDAYFKRYRVTNMGISGIPCNLPGMSGGELEKVLIAINARYRDRSSYVLTSNLNTGATESGERSWFILVAGRGPALADLAKLIILKNTEGYSDEIKAIVKGWETNPKVGMPITNTFVTLPPHDPNTLNPSLDEHLRVAREKGLSVKKPGIPVLHNWHGIDMSKQKDAFADGDLLPLLHQQYTLPVSVPTMLDRVLGDDIRATTIIGMGPGDYLASTALPANAGKTPVEIIGVVGKDSEGVDKWKRLTTNNPVEAYASPKPVETKSDLKIIMNLPGITVRQDVLSQDGVTPNGKRTTIRVDQELGYGDASLAPILKELSNDSPVIQFLLAYGVAREGQPPLLLLNKPNIEYRLDVSDSGPVSIALYEKGRLSYEIHLEDGKIIFNEGEIQRVFSKTEDSFQQINLDAFRASTRAAYAKIWDLDPHVVSASSQAIVTGTQEVTVERMLRFANAVQTRDAKYLNPANPDFQAHPHFLIDLGWKAMLAPTFSNELDLDFTRVIDEGKTIELGASIKPGDKITFGARATRVEDFKEKSYEGRRVVVTAIATNQRGETVGRIVSTMVSRIPTGLKDGEVKEIQSANILKGHVDLLQGKMTHVNPEPKMVAKGLLTIPLTLADTYGTIDPNPIHLSDASARMAGIPRSRILQGLGTLAYVNEQVIAQVQRDLNFRKVVGVSNLKFSGFVYPGDELTYEISQKAVSEGTHTLEVSVKRGAGTVMKYDLVIQGQKTAIIFTGQGSQYVGMGDDITSRDDFKKMLGLLQSWIPKKEGTKTPVVDLFAEMNKGTTDTSKAQPMIISYELILFVDSLWNGLIPDDAVYTGHSLGEWGAYLACLIHSRFKAFRAEGKIFASKYDFLKALAPILKPVMHGLCMRGEVMQKYADPKNPQSLITVTSSTESGPLTKEKIAVLQEFINQEGNKKTGVLPRYIGVSNYNMRKLTVLGGHRSALEMATPILEAWGFVVKKVNVDNAFHTELMRVASADFTAWRKAQKRNPFALFPDMQLYMDTKALPLSEVGNGDLEALATTLSEQISTSVQWHGTVARMLKDGVTRIVEFGPSSQYDKELKRTVGAAVGQLSSMSRSEADALKKDGLIPARPDLIFANPILAPHQADYFAGDLVNDPTVYTKPRLVAAPPRAAAQSAATPEVVPGVGQTEPAPQAAAQPAVVPVTPAQVSALVSAYVTEQKADLDAGKNLESHAGNLAEQIVRLGAGAFAPMQARLSALSVPAAAGAPAAGPSLEERIIAFMIEKGHAKAGKINGQTTLKDDLKIGTGDQAGVYEELGQALKVNAAPSDIQNLGDNPTMSAIADMLQKAGGTAAPAGAAPQASSLSSAEQLEKKALEISLTRLPRPMVSQAQSFAVAPVSAAQVDEVKAAFLREHPEISQGVTDTLVGALAQKYEALGAGVVVVLQARLAGLTTSVGAAATPATGPSLEERIIGFMIEKGHAKAGKINGQTTLKDDLKIGTGDQAGVYEELGQALKVNAQPSDIQNLGDNPTMSAIADMLQKAGGAVAAPATSGAGAPALSLADQMDKRAIEQALPRLMAQMPTGGGVAIADPAIVARVTALEAQIAELRAILASRQAPAASGQGDVRVVLTDGTLQDPLQVRLKELETLLANVVTGSSETFVYDLMQPHFDPSKIYSFGEVERNGGRNNLMKFIADARAGRLPTDLYQYQARITQLANQLDEISLGWLETFLKKENPGKARVALDELASFARQSIQKGLITGNVITIRGGKHVPEYGAPQKTNFVPHTWGTKEEAKLLSDKKIADPKTADDLKWLMEQGVDLRGKRVLVHEAGTMSAPLIAKLLQFGADVYVTNYTNRSRTRPDGESQNDFFYRLFNENAARGAKLTVLPNMQPGNPHDEEALLDYFKMAANILISASADTRASSDTSAEAFKRQKDAIEMLPEDTFGLEMRKKLAEAEHARKHGQPTAMLILSDEEKQKAVSRLLPQLYINGAAKVKYDDVTKRGDPYTPLSVLVLASRHIALNLAKMHQQYKTGERVVFLNFTSPNNGENAAEKEGELLPSALPWSGYYDLAKAALGAGHTASVAKANGIVDANGKAILVEVSRKTGWGKSDGTGPTLMSENDYFSEAVEAQARALGIDLRTLTGDELATLQLSGVLAVMSGQRKGEHLHYDDTYGFSKAAKSGKLGKIFAEARAEETKKQTEAKAAWAVAHPKKEVPVDLPNDGSILDLNNLNIAIRGVSADHRYALNPDDLIFDDDTPVITGYGMVGPLGPDALTNYRGMLARGHFKGHEGVEWLGTTDFYNLARSVGVDVKGWDEKRMAEMVGLTAEDAAKNKNDWGKTFRDWLHKNSGIQQMDEFVEFDIERDFQMPEDTQVDVTDAGQIQKLTLAGFEIFRRADGSTYALARKGQTYKLPMKLKMPVTFVGQLPGANHAGFDFKRFGVGHPRDARPEAHGAQMAKMITGQILMSMGGYSPTELQEEFGAENMFVALGAGLGDLKPFNKMTVDPILKSDKVANYLVAGFLADSWAGQVATEQLGAEGMALCVVAACSTGNANYETAVKLLFGHYYQETKKAGTVDWDKVFKKIWIAGGMDSAANYNSIFGFLGVGALITDEWLKKRDIPIDMASRPDDKERSGFVTATGGGAISMMPLGHAKRHGKPVYSMYLGGAFRTDGDKLKEGGAREGYGKGQRGAIMESWEQAKGKLTVPKFSREKIRDMLRDLHEEIGSSAFDKKSAQVRFLWGVKEKFGLDLAWKQVAAWSFPELIEHIFQNTHVLHPKVKFIVIAHKTSTGAGDPYEEDSIRLFLEKILPPGEFAHIMKSKAYLGHLLGGSSSVDAALTPLVLRYLALIGTPGLDNLGDHAAFNATLFHNREAIDLNDLYDPDTIYVVLREAAGFNAKNTAIFETRGKVAFDKEGEALAYTKGVVEAYARERTQKRAEREDLRTMGFYADAFPDISINTYRDLQELTLRSEAVAKALLSGKKFDFENILGWIYQFPVNKEIAPQLNARGIELGDQLDTFAREDRRVTAMPDGAEKTAAQKAANEQRAAFQNSVSNLNQYNAIKYAEAYDQVADILASFDVATLKKIGDEARAKGWDKQPVVFYGVSDGMGLRTLLALIASGAVKEVVGVHFDLPVNNPKMWAGKVSSFTPEILKAYAAAKGVNLQVFNENGILYSMRNDQPNNITAGDALPLQKNIEQAVEAARGRSKIKDILFWDYVAFGSIVRRPEDKELFVPSVDDYGQLSLAKVPPAKDAKTAEVMTLNTMGKNHTRLLELFLERGWLGKKSVTFAADWWGSESVDMLYGVYGGAVLGDAKLIQKQEIIDFAKAHSNSGKHGYKGYPAFLSFALHMIPGGTLTGVIAKRIYEDITNGVDIPGLGAKARRAIRGYSMEELAIGAVLKAVQGDYSAGFNGVQNKIDMDSAEKLIAREIDRRFKAVDAALQKALEGKEGDKLSPEESLALLKKYVPDDYLKYCYQHIKEVRDRIVHQRKLAQEKNGIDRLPLPEKLATQYPFFARAIKGVNTTELAIQMIDAGGVGTLMADDVSVEELKARITKIKEAVGEDAPLVVNIMMSHPGKEAQIEALLQNKPVAVSFGNGLVTTDIVDKLHAAGILVIQLVGSVAAVKGLAAKKVDLIIAERNYGPGHISRDKTSDPEKLIKAIRQEVYDAHIPVIAGGGFVEAEDVQNALHWGASAIQLDDPVAYSAESTYAGKRMLEAPGTSKNLLEVLDGDEKPIRFLDTEGGRALMKKLALLRSKEGLDKKTLRPLIDRLITLAILAADTGDVKNGIFFSSERIGKIKANESLESIFARLSGEQSPAAPVTPMPAALPGTRRASVRFPKDSAGVSAKAKVHNKPSGGQKGTRALGSGEILAGGEVAEPRQAHTLGHAEVLQQGNTLAVLAESSAAMLEDEYDSLTGQEALLRDLRRKGFAPMADRLSTQSLSPQHVEAMQRALDRGQPALVAKLGGAISPIKSPGLRTGAMASFTRGPRVGGSGMFRVVR